MNRRAATVFHVIAGEYAIEKEKRRQVQLSVRPNETQARHNISALSSIGWGLGDNQNQKLDPQHHQQQQDWTHREQHQSRHQVEQWLVQPTEGHGDTHTPATLPPKHQISMGQSAGQHPACMASSEEDLQDRAGMEEVPGSLMAEERVKESTKL
ncbi:hypothetical protein SKAU_G00368370 [Synaphobranchus kaupii]|uniref:Uncharacterized protein n=1 Tax=Synaphobranchus kaupii TaxID=118154 RepID=A0A9Q1EFJ8_SYNKA|nr:hypothetical protein SKAU_G00368370 [Synaphobranchus kaupii]